jgi:Zn-dependent protease
MKGSVRMAAIAGVEISLHWTLVVYAALILLLPGLGDSLVMRGTYVLLLFASVLLHELGHVAGARFCDGSAHQILLWPLGGLAFVDVPETPTAHFLTALAGPLVSLFLWLGGAWMGTTMGWWWLRYVGEINAALFLFNLLPAYPMDAGRLLHSVLWRKMGYARALWICVHISMALAVGMFLWAFLGGGIYALLGSGWAVYVFFNAWQERELLKQDAVAGEYWSGRPGVAYNHPYQQSESWLHRRRQRREEQREKNDQEFVAREIDPILDKISREGMQSLTRRERKVLESARDLMQKRQR